MGRLGLLLVAATFGACAAALPAPSASPSASPSAVDPFIGAAIDGPGLIPPGCAAVGTRLFADGASLTEYRCESGLTDLEAVARRIRSAAAAGLWRECTPGLLFVRGDVVASVTIAGGRDGIRVTVASAKRVAPAC